MADKVDHIASLLESDRNQDGGPIGYSPNLLPIHYQLQQLEAFRNETLHQAKKSDAAEREVLTKWFEKLDQVGEAFEAWLWEISKNIVELARRGNGGTVVRLLKIIEVEGKEDEKVSHLPLSRLTLGRGNAPGAQSSQYGCCLKVQIDAGKRACDQELPA